MSALFSPYALGPLPLTNRIAIAPMCQYSADAGIANEWHMIHLGSLALSGAALLFTEAAAVTAQGRITGADLGLWSDQTQAALAPVIAAIRKHAPIRIALQLAHAGRKASSQKPWDGGASIHPFEPGGWQTVAPSALPHAPGDAVPIALDVPGMQQVKQAFVDAALRAVQLGVDALELHAAHGYLLHQFLSPIANQRSDDYGGSLANRMRFPLEVFEAVSSAVRAALPQTAPQPITLGVRISATDWVAGGWDIEQSVAFAHALKTAGADFIHVSSGGISPLQKIPLEPGYQVAFAARIKHETGLPTIAVGLITDAEHAEAIIAGGDADIVALARAMLYDPRWPWHAAAKLGATVDAPPQYWRSQPSTQKQLFDTTLRDKPGQR
jgi:2,4-dienoyl-CoA reductase-like NADH-dependent reductase (Old Yellow Enzyme family)